MDEFWNTSVTAPAALDSFFDEESTVPWTGMSGQSIVDLESFSTPPSINSVVSKIPTKSLDTSSNLNSILENISLDSPTSVGLPQSRSVSKALGDTLESLKNPSFKWNRNSTDSASCLQCQSKEEEIRQLKQRLEKSYSKHNITLPPEDIVRRMVLGESYSLEPYKRLDDKLALVDYAIDSTDSSTILEVLIFLKRTLKKTLFVDVLKKRPIACQTYVEYLKKRCFNKEALEILISMGRREDAMLLEYETAITPSNNRTKINNLRSSFKKVPADPQFAHVAKIFEQHADLLESQLEIDKEDSCNTKNAMLTEHPRVINITGQTRLSTLFYCCMYHWLEPETKPTSPLYLRKAYGLSDRQFLWVVLRARIRVKHWPMPSELDNLLAPPGLLRSLGSLSPFTAHKASVKNILAIDQVVSTLYDSGAPSSVIAAYIDLMPSAEEKLKSGHLYKCHQVVVESYIALKDRASLEKYLLQMPAGSPEFVKAENALKVSNTNFPLPTSGLRWSMALNLSVSSR